MINVQKKGGCRKSFVLRQPPLYSIIIKFYEIKIDDISDEDTREKLLEKLEEVYDMLMEIDFKIDEELENQEAEMGDVSLDTSLSSDNDEE